MKLNTILPLFVPISSLERAQPQISTMKALVLRLYITKFGQNWPETLRGDVENVKS